MPCRPDISRLREEIAALGLRSLPVSERGEETDLCAALAEATGIGLHEVCASSPRHVPSTLGFALGLSGLTKARRLIWVYQRGAGPELGEPYGPGLKAWGLDPDGIVIVRASDPRALLGATEEALRSGAAEVVLVSSWGELRPYDLSASRRIAMAADKAGCRGVMICSQPPGGPTAARTRWSVMAASSAPLPVLAPGFPAVRARLLKSRKGTPPAEWIMEWDREQRTFRQAPQASGSLVSASADRPGAQERGGQWKAA